MFLRLSCFGAFPDPRSFEGSLSLLEMFASGDWCVRSNDFIIRRHGMANISRNLVTLFKQHGYQHAPNSSCFLHTQFLRPSWPWGFFFARWVESEPDRGAEGKVPWRCHYKMSTWPHFFCARRLRAPGHQLRSDWHLPWNSLSSSRPSELFRVHPGVDGLSDWPGRDLAIGLGISVFRCVGFFQPRRMIRDSDG